MEDLYICLVCCRYFADFLRERGPLRLDHPDITSELQQFPPEASIFIEKAGGIGKFLIQSLQFAMIDEYVCLMQDAVKARNLVMENKKALQPTPVYSPAVSSAAPVFPSSSTSSVVYPSPDSGVKSSSSVSDLCDFSPIEKKKKKKLALEMDATTSSPEHSQSPTVDVKDLFKKKVYEAAGKPIEEDDSAKDSQRDTESPYSIASDLGYQRRNSTSSVAGSEPELDVLKQIKGQTKPDSASSSSTPNRIPPVPSPSASPSRALFLPAKPDMQKKVSNVKNLWNLSPATNIPEETESLTKLAPSWEGVQSDWNKIVKENQEPNSLLSNLPIPLPTSVPTTAPSVAPSYYSQSSMEDIDDIDDISERLNTEKNTDTDIPVVAPAIGASKFGAIGSSKEGSPVRVPSTKYLASNPVVTNSYASSISPLSTMPPFPDTSKSPVAFMDPPKPSNIPVFNPSQPPPGFVPASSKWSNIGKAVGEAIHQENNNDVATTSSLFSQQSIWSDGINAISQEINANVMNVCQQADNSLVEETAEYVHAKLQGSDAFNTPELYNNIVSSIKHDFEQKQQQVPLHLSLPQTEKSKTAEIGCGTGPLEELSLYQALKDERKRVEEELAKTAELCEAMRNNMTREMRSVKSQLDSYQVECRVSGLFQSFV